MIQMHLWSEELGECFTRLFCSLNILTSIELSAQCWPSIRAPDLQTGLRASHPVDVWGFRSRQHFRSSIPWLWKCWFAFCSAVLIFPFVLFLFQPGAIEFCTNGANCTLVSEDERSIWGAVCTWKYCTSSEDSVSNGVAVCCIVAEISTIDWRGQFWLQRWAHWNHDLTIGLCSSSGTTATPRCSGEALGDNDWEHDRLLKKGARNWYL